MTCTYTYAVSFQAQCLIRLQCKLPGKSSSDTHTAASQPGVGESGRCFPHIRACKYQLTQPPPPLSSSLLGNIRSVGSESTPAVISPCFSYVFLSTTQVLPCSCLPIFLYNWVWTAGSSSVSSHCPVWSGCLCSTLCVWRTMSKPLTRRRCNNSHRTVGSCPT